MADLTALRALTDQEAKWPDDLADEAFHGIVGKLVRTIAPETEADAAGLHASILVAAGNAIGRGPHFRIDADLHHPALFASIVGKTSGGKGLSLGRAKQVTTPADDQWAKNCLVDGLSTGEGLISHVRDPREERRPAKDEEMGQADDDGFITEVVDPGVEDKRVLVTASEFAQLLTAASREGNTLTSILRALWDNGTAQSLTRNNPIRTTNSHVSIVSHITEEELRKKLSLTDSLNGFGNRFLWVCVKRARKLPFGGNLTDEDLEPLITELTGAIRVAQTLGKMTMKPDAGKVWEHAYHHELTADREGLFGAITQRAHAISLRIAVLFAALDGTTTIEVPHVEAALATWHRAEQSAAYLFGGSSGDVMADRIRSLLIEAGSEGIRRREIRTRLGSGNYKTTEIAFELKKLADAGLITSVTEDTAGRPAERFFHTEDLRTIGTINTNGNGAST